jgi:hypothetical protein
MEILKQLGAFLGWVSGVVAGITAVLYAFGFVATTAHQSMLGLSWGVVSRDTLWYLGVGGQVIARWTLLALLVFLFVIVAGETILRSVGWAKARSGKALGWLAGPAGWFDRNVVWFIALLVMVVGERLMENLESVLAVRGLLFLDPATLCSRDGIVSELVNNDTEALRDRAGTIALYSALAIGIGAYAVPRFIAGDRPAIPLLVCIAVGLNSLFAIPIAHGICIVEPRWGALSGQGGAIGQYRDGQLRLLARTADGVWAWEPLARHVHLFSAGPIDQLDIGPAKRIRDVACS